jgi:hypothetical protein
VLQSLALRQLLKLQGKGRQHPPPSHLCALQVSPSPRLHYCAELLTVGLLLLPPAPPRPPQQHHGHVWHLRGVHFGVACCFAIPVKNLTFSRLQQIGFQVILYILLYYDR